MLDYITLAKSYHRFFHGRDVYPIFLSVIALTWLILAIATTIGTAYYFYSILHVYKYSEIPLIVTIIFEVVGLVVWFALDSVVSKIIDANIIRKSKNTLNINIKTVFEARYLFFIIKTGKKPSDFLNEAKKIEDILRMQNSLKGLSDSARDSFLPAIYDPGSKPRLIALFIATISLFSALVVFKVDNSQYLMFEMLSNSNGLKTFLLLLLSAIEIFLFLLMIKIIAITILDKIVSLSNGFSSATIGRVWLLKKLAKDLVLYHTDCDGIVFMNNKILFLRKQLDSDILLNKFNPML